jgi:plastocyanin/N-acetylneuraminic acid mutarotase
MDKIPGMSGGSDKKQAVGAGAVAAILIILIVLGTLAIYIADPNVLKSTETVTSATTATTTVTLSATASSAINGTVGSWSKTGPLHVARAFAGAALLPDGTVLAAGGFAGAVNQSSLSSAEIYNPSTGTWTMTASMHEARAAPTATLLNTGKVLVAGGLGLKGPVATSEIYNPVAGTWTVTGNMTVPRFDQTAMLLKDGRVLVLGGNFGHETAVAEIYDPNTGTWTQASPQPLARTDAFTVLLNDGRVLVAGGTTGKSATVISEIYDPVQNTWTQTGSMNVPQDDGAGVLLKNGSVLVAGGYNTYNDTDATIQDLYKAEIYNPSSGKWTMTGDMAFPRGETEDASVALNDGTVLVPGGLYQTETGQASAELYNPATGRWLSAGDMSVARAEGAMGVLLRDGRVLVFGGLLSHRSAPDVPTTSADLYTPSQSTATTSSSGLSSSTGVQVTIPSGSGTNTNAAGFAPSSITVVIGVNNTVTWTNRDSVAHTVTDVGGAFDSGNMNAGAVFSYTFTQPGTYSIKCSYHSWMHMTIIVKSK